jgi:hypothetical protein
MYGIHINMHPSVKIKRVVIHRLSCPSYKQNTKKGHAQSEYAFSKNAKNMRDAIEKASKYSLEWQAPIYVCKKCFTAKRKFECSF